MIQQLVQQLTIIRTCVMVRATEIVTQQVRHKIRQQQFHEQCIVISCVFMDSNQRASRLRYSVNPKVVVNAFGLIVPVNAFCNNVIQ